MREAIIFDFDGVIIDSECYHFQAFQKILHEMNIPLDYETYMSKGYVGLPDHANIIKLFNEKQIPLNEQIINDILHKKERLFTDIVNNEKLQPIPGIIAIIEAAYQKKLPIAISSGACRSDISAVLNNLLDGKLLDYFPIRVSSSDVENSKPAPDSYLLAAKLLNVNPKNSVAIEDSPHGIAAAKAAGLKVFAVTTTSKVEELQQADEIINDLQTLTLDKLLTD